MADDHERCNRISRRLPPIKRSMSQQQSFRTSVVTKLAGLNILICLLVIGIVSITAFSFFDVKDSLTRLIDEEIAQMLTNANVGRELSTVFADTNLLVATFTEVDSVLDSEGNRLLRILQESLTHISTEHSTLSEPLQEFSQAFQQLLEHCAVIQEQQQAIHTDTAQLEDLLNEVDTLVGERLLEGSRLELASLESLGVMMPTYYQRLLQVTIQVNAMTQAHLGTQEVEQPYAQQIGQILDTLMADARVINSTGQRFLPLGEQFISLTQQYQRTIASFAGELTTLQEQLRALDTAEARVQQAMSSMDEDLASSSKVLQHDVDGSIRSSLLLILSLSGGMVVVLIVVSIFGVKMVQPLRSLVATANRLADGDLTETIIETRSRDEIGVLADAIRTMQTNIQQMLLDVQGLLQAVQEGKFTTRGNTEGYAGSWRDLIGGLNNVIDAFVDPITVTATALARVSKGDIPGKITTDYQGDFNITRDSINELIDTMEQITEVAEQISVGNLTIDVRKRSEHDRLMSALGKMISGMQEIAQSAEEMSTGNLMVSLQERSEQDTLMQALNAMIRHLQSVVTDVQKSAKTIGTVSQELSSSSEQLSNGASEQAAAMEESSSSMEEMAANIRQNADNARQTENIALQSREYAEEAGRVVAETVMAMQQIAQKIAIVEDIANQTRMLSLNATIEAARAQDHGKAFSVVAAEVRQLSEVTKKAAEEISQLAVISLEVSEKAGTMLGTLVPSIQKTTELIQEISAASNEQSSGTEQINRAIQQADQITQQNATIAEQTASSAEELSNQAQQLQQTIAFFQVDNGDRKRLLTATGTLTGEVKDLTSITSLAQDGETPAKTSIATEPRDDEFMRY
jgi:methyl-accepting chemotaxis protein